MASTLTRAARSVGTFTLQQAMLRVKDPKPAVEFFTKHFGMTLIDKKSFPDSSFDLYFLASLPDDHPPIPTPGTPEANHFLWTFERTVIELTHNYGTESKEEKVYWNGNEEPHRGFGHVGFIVDSIAEFCDRLERDGVKFQKKLTDGSMKTIAFALEPSTNYWVEILPRSTKFPATEVRGKPSFQQVMLRIKDPKVTIPFYETHFGLNVVCVRHYPQWKFSLYFCGTFPAGTSLPSDVESEEAWEFANSLSTTLLEFTHNHGTEADAGFSYCNGNTDPGRGFGHIGFLTDDLDGTCEKLEKDGVAFKKRPSEGKMRGLAFAMDPDGYWIEIIRRGLEM
jgi:lactoylglutathione lyase